MSPRRCSRSCSSVHLSRSRCRGRATPALVLAWCCLCQPRAAAAEWLLTPFIGFKIDGQTNLAGVDQAAAETRLTLGGSGALLGDGLFGLEADFGYTPGF